MLTTQSEKYEPSKVERIRKMLQIQQQTGSRPCYSIFVDGMEVISKVEDINLFDQLQDLILDSSQTLEIHTYLHDKSKLAGKFTFYLKDKPIEEKLPSQALGETEINGIVERRVMQERERWETEQLKKELTSKEHDLEQAEEFIDKLLIAIEEMKKNEESQGSSFSQGLLNVLSVVKDFAPMFLKDKVNTQLTGAPETTESTATFKAKQQEKSAESISDEDKKRLEKIHQREKTFTPDEQNKLDQIIDELSQEKGALDVLIEGFRQSKEMNKPQ